MAKKNKLPKRIAGVKLPKRMRKGPMVDFIRSRGGQLLFAEAVLALGAFYAARRFETNMPIEAYGAADQARGLFGEVSPAAAAGITEAVFRPAAIEHARPSFISKLGAPIRRWLTALGARYLKRRIARELAEYDRPPELQRRSLGRLVRPRQQVFRSLVQVNFYARERDER